jgi:hypothetical protein
MGGNFDDVLRIENGRVSPRGPLKLDDDETMLKLHAWVVQKNDDGTGAACEAFQGADGFTKDGVWTTKPGAVHEGVFQPGPATGWAVAISKSQPHGKTRVFSWGDEFTLE